MKLHTHVDWCLTVSTKLFICHIDAIFIKYSLHMAYCPIMPKKQVRRSKMVRWRPWVLKIRRVTNFRSTTSNMMVIFKMDTVFINYLKKLKTSDMLSSWYQTRSEKYENRYGGQYRDGEFNYDVKFWNRQSLH